MSDAGLNAQRSSRAVRIGVGIAAAAIAAIGVVLLFLLTQATNNRELYERNYGILFAINMVVATVLLTVILWIVIRLAVRLRRGKFGSRLLVKLAATFALVGLVPGVLIYTVSYQFVSRSIESWFDVKVEGALNAGLALGKATLDTLASDAAAKSRVAATQLAEISDASAGLALERIRDQLGATDVTLWTASAQLIAGAGTSRFQLNPERPSLQMLRNARTQRSISMVEGLDDPGTPGSTENARIKAIAFVASNNLGLISEARFLQVTIGLPPAVVANAIAVTEANREYQERALARQGLQRMYIGTLTLSLFLAVFGAVLLAILLGNQLARPLLLLAGGVREVAAGDLSPKPALQGRDELDGLTRSFAQMTQQLSDARGAVEKSMEQVDAARANLQTILDNLTAGVIVLDEEGNVLSSNPGATRILRAPLAAFEGRRLAGIPGLEAFAAGVIAQFEAFMSERLQHGLDHWQQSFELAEPQQSGGQQNNITLVVRGAIMPGEARLLVFDDISEIVSAQRAQAWGEVARRLAHEIKNPLTPIQLSAERLEMKLAGKVDEAGGLVLAKSVKTIVEQVDAMKRLVNEFRDYARLPAAELKPLDLNTLVNDVLQLYGSENALVPVRAELAPDCPRILGDAQQLRQVIHNLLQNAQDATSEEAAKTGRQGEVVIRTQWTTPTGPAYRPASDDAPAPTGQRVRLSILDNGHGFPEHILKRAFEPYVTTKVRGTGLGLAVVKKIADEHHARIDISNRLTEGVIQGAQVSLSFAVAAEQQPALRAAAAG